MPKYTHVRTRQWPFIRRNIYEKPRSLNTVKSTVLCCISFVNQIKWKHSKVRLRCPGSRHRVAGMLRRHFSMYHCNARCCDTIILTSCGLKKKKGDIYTFFFTTGVTVWQYTDCHGDLCTSPPMWNTCREARLHTWKLPFLLLCRRKTAKHVRAKSDGFNTFGTSGPRLNQAAVK